MAEKKVYLIMDKNEFRSDCNIERVYSSKRRAEEYVDYKVNTLGYARERYVIIVKYLF